MCYNESTKVVDTAISAVNMCDKKSLTNVHKLLQVLSVLPVSTAEAGVDRRPHRLDTRPAVSMPKVSRR